MGESWGSDYVRTRTEGRKEDWRVRKKQGRCLTAGQAAIDVGVVATRATGK